MATEFSREFFSANRIVKADLRAARQPREDDITRIKAEVKKLYDATEVLLNTRSPRPRPDDGGQALAGYPQDPH